MLGLGFEKEKKNGKLEDGRCLRRSSLLDFLMFSLIVFLFFFSLVVAILATLMISWMPTINTVRLIYFKKKTKTDYVFDSIGWAKQIKQHIWWYIALYNKRWLGADVTSNKIRIEQTKFPGFWIFKQFTKDKTKPIY